MMIFTTFLKCIESCPRTISIFKVVFSFYHVHWHPTLMREYNKMQEKLERAQDQHLEFVREDFMNKEFYGKRIEPEFQGILRS